MKIHIFCWASTKFPLTWSWTSTWPNCFHSGMEPRCLKTTNELNSFLLYNTPDKMEKQALPKFCFLSGGRGGSLACWGVSCSKQISCLNKITPGDFGKQEQISSFTNNMLQREGEKKHSSNYDPTVTTCLSRHTILHTLGYQTGNSVSQCRDAS